MVRAQQVNHTEFDLEQYASKYSGHAKINRLVFLANQTKDKGLQRRGIELALAEIKKSNNVKKYTSVVSANPNLAVVQDEQWVANTTTLSTNTLRQLEKDLNDARSNMVKEGIRIGHIDMGDFFYDCGDLTHALKSYVRSKDYCDSIQHTLQMSLNVIRVSIELGQHGSVSSYGYRALQTLGGKPQNLKTLAQVQSAMALSALCEGDFEKAADKFVNVNQELGSTFNSVVASEDVALYGSICALAAFDRKQLKAKVLENPSFKTFLELTPEIRQLVLQFSKSDYGRCLQHLEQLRPELCLDMYLSPFVPKLFRMIRQRALIQYCLPYSTVMLEGMAQVFNTTIPDLELELAELIMEEKIQARIDGSTKMLVSRQSDQRTTTYEHALSAGSQYIRETTAFLVRVNMLSNNFVLNSTKQPSSLRMDHDPDFRAGGFAASSPSTEWNYT